jgi:methylated-DNA-[protein]-cysteine S-methyltransferase
MLHHKENRTDMTLTLQSISTLDLHNRPVAFDVFQDPWDATHSGVFRIATMQDAHLSGLIALQYSHNGKAKTLPEIPDNWNQNKEALAPVIQKLKAYLAGEIPQWDENILLCGGAFTCAVWQILAQVPYGNTISYTTLAAQAGNPKAVRAAATACAINPVPLIIPCHRVLAKDGTLGGFAWGLTWKQRLLAMEATQHAQLSAAS